MDTCQQFLIQTRLDGFSLWASLQADLLAATEKPVRYPLPEVLESVVGTKQADAMFGRVTYLVL